GGGSARSWEACGSPSVVRRLDGIEPLLGPVEVLARAGLAVPVDLRLRARAVDLRHRERAEEDEPPVVDLEGPAIKRADGRAGCAVALGVVLAAVARAAEAGRYGRDERQLAAGGVLGLRLQ